MNVGLKKKMAEGNYRVGTPKITLPKFFLAAKLLRRSRRIIIRAPGITWFRSRDDRKTQLDHNTTGRTERKVNLSSPFSPSNWTIQVKSPGRGYKLKL